MAQACPPPLVHEVLMRIELHDVDRAAPGKRAQRRIGDGMVAADDRRRWAGAGGHREDAGVARNSDHSSSTAPGRLITSSAVIASPFAARSIAAYPLGERAASRNSGVWPETSSAILRYGWIVGTIMLTLPMSDDPTPP